MRRLFGCAADSVGANAPGKPVCMQRRSDKRRRDACCLCHHVKEAKRQSVIALGPVERYPGYLCACDACACEFEGEVASSSFGAAAGPGGKDSIQS